MQKLQPVRGTHDLLPETARRHLHVIESGRGLAERFGYQPIDTPIFEFTDVFQRTLGETSDVVTKEMYRFTDKGGDDVTLRPEGTAGVVRAVLSNGLLQDAPLKFFYAGPMFRYERPQKGRLRQFHQIGVELIGVARPEGDVEVIALGAEILKTLGVGGQVTLHLNTLGDAESRAAYRKALVAYLDGRKGELSPDSLTRLALNPMRILDSKDAGDKQVVADAPRIGDFLTPAAAAFFASVRSGLESLDLTYTVDDRLVRGLDYYCHTAFEFVTDALGAQGTVLAGGRYDGLVETMGGPPTAGVGWAAGIERLAMLLAAPPSAPRPVAVIPVGDAEEALAFGLAHRLRLEGIAVDIGFGGSMKARMKRAGRVNARVAVLLGETERARGVATVRDMDTGQQSEVPLDALARHLAVFR
ncbi:MAG: histidine--tRNA ligase [Alphaproteobacteria bacterium]|nr:histidine--tRNA ligase [Alphaproteobacteria bacterium]